MIDTTRHKKGHKKKKPLNMISFWCSTTEYSVILYDFSASAGSQNRTLAVGATRVEQTFTVPSSGKWDMLIYSGVRGSTSGISMESTDIMVQKGNKATAYQTAVDFLAECLKDSHTTDVSCGLVLTNVLMLRDFDNTTVTAGMSGLTLNDKGEKDNVLLWGGGSYFDAFKAAMPNSDYKKLDNTPITTLLKKDGTGKIGIFRVSEKDVVVKMDNGSVVINAESGISVHDKNGNEKVLITDKTIDLSTLRVNEDVNLPKTQNLTRNSQIIDPNGSKMYFWRKTIPARTDSVLRIKNLKVSPVKHLIYMSVARVVIFK